MVSPLRTLLLASKNAFLSICIGGALLAAPYVTNAATADIGTADIASPSAGGGTTNSIMLMFVSYDQSGKQYCNGAGSDCSSSSMTASARVTASDNVPNGYIIQLEVSSIDFDVINVPGVSEYTLNDIAGLAFPEGFKVELKGLSTYTNLNGQVIDLSGKQLDESGSITVNIVVEP
jgi:hypothetical protein